MRLIDADALIEDILALPNCPNGFSDTYDKARIIGVIEEQPTIESDWNELMVICDNCGHAIHVKRTDAKPTIEERKKGKWIYLTGVDAFECSVCGRQMVRNIFDYCPWCGADMRGET